ncbi:DUF3795 domain-containing protein [uncultured Methanomethylovorans sp.]|uniref:DUF3795 domain-containing protein n=1 Tax=uncultured Methanomethylovorans sp. TaxID=183759 RepID=UPI002AA5F5D7|nr:DUF3795 domain-containing protein [uncultured Methanomethylovorans sp.]
MLSPDLTILHILFISISLLGGMAATYFWIKVYEDTKRGSIAWLLLALTAIFLITTAIFPSFAVGATDQNLVDTILLFLGFWSAVYTSIFAAAGFLMFKAFKTIPRQNLGDFLIEGMVFRKPEQKIEKYNSNDTENISKLLEWSTLIEYTPRTRYEDSVIEMCLRFYGETMNVVLVSTEPRTSLYKNRLGELVDIGAMKFIELSSTEEKLMEKDGIIILPKNELDSLFDLTSKLPAGCALIFEPFSDLLLTEGEDTTYTFASRMVEKFASKDILLVGLINNLAHPKDIVSRLEGLFVNIAEESDNSIKVVKGGKEEFIRFYAGKRFFLENEAVD